MGNKPTGKALMTGKELDRIMSRFAYEILEAYPECADIAVVGIHTGGAYLARRLVEKLEKLEEKTFDLGLLDITLYRDDLAMEKEQPIVRRTEIPFKVTEKVIILVDDVLYTGRTVRAALDALIDFGRPKTIQLAVIIDRGLRELPIRPDYVGRAISTTPDQTVRVLLREEGHRSDRVLLEMGD